MQNKSGIIVCSGGWRLPMTWANVVLLRFLGTTLPIEVWHMPGEMTQGAAELLRLAGASTRVLYAKARGYWTVPFAVAESDFEEVVVLASDFTPLTGLDALFGIPAYRKHGALLATDMGDLRDRSWYPEGWTRLGLEAPTCPESVRCLAVWETDSVVMVLDKRRCPGGGVLRALAADGQESKRYGTSGDKELYRLAWEAVGCSVTFLPYPAVVGTYWDSEFVGFAMAPKAASGELLGLHWAWSKSTLHGFLPKMGKVQSAPKDGYALHIVDTMTLPDILTDKVLATAGDELSFSYSVRMTSCYAASGSEVPCSFEDFTSAGPPKADILLELFSDLLDFARRAFHDCTEGDVGARCGLRPYISPHIRRLVWKQLKKSRLKLDA